MRPKFSRLVSTINDLLEKGSDYLKLSKRPLLDNQSLQLIAKSTTSRDLNEYELVHNSDGPSVTTNYMLYETIDVTAC